MSSYRKETLLERARNCEIRSTNAQNLAAERFRESRELEEAGARCLALALGHIARLDALHEQRKGDLYREAVREAEQASIEWQKQAS